LKSLTSTGLDLQFRMQFCFAAGAAPRYKGGMSDPVVFQKGPIVRKVEPGTYWWCACGRSASQPFCDGSHKGTGMAPVKTEVAAAQTMAWCGCKHSGKKPFCDGSHNRLP
jgi:CDGSH-type Zn-finger protein